MAYALMLGFFMIFVLIQSFLAYRQRGKFFRLYQLGAVQDIFQKHQWQLMFVLLQSLVIFGLMLACGLSLLQSLSSLDGITGAGYGLFLAWLCVRYFRSAMILNVVKNGALYL